MATQTEDKWQNAREQAQAQFESIREMVAALEAAQDEAKNNDSDATELEEAQQHIQEDALSVEVRSGWYMPGSFIAAEACAPAEYRILLCTGSPAVQIMGSLNAHGEPETACLQMQDWFLPWTEYRPTVTDCEGDKHTNANAEEILLAYARQFYFGE